MVECKYEYNRECGINLISLSQSKCNNCEYKFKCEFEFKYG